MRTEKMHTPNTKNEWKKKLARVRVAVDVDVSPARTLKTRNAHVLRAVEAKKASCGCRRFCFRR